MDEPPFLSGRLLLAMPGMADPRFDRAVIAMAVHDAQGAVGIGIGQLRAGLRFRQLLKQLGVEPGESPDCPVHHGGPVEPGRGFVLHTEDWGLKCSLDVVGIGPSGVAMLNGTSGKRSPTWIVMIFVSFSMKRPVSGSGDSLKTCSPESAGASLA